MGLEIWDWTDKWLPTSEDGDDDDMVWIRRHQKHNVYSPLHWKDIKPGNFWCHTPYWWTGLLKNPDAILRLDVIRRKSIENAIRQAIPPLLGEAEEIRYCKSDRAHHSSLRELSKAQAALGLMNTLYIIWRPAFPRDDSTQEVAS